MDRYRRENNLQWSVMWIFKADITGCLLNSDFTRLRGIERYQQVKPPHHSHHLDSYL